MKRSLALPAITCARAGAQLKPARNGSKYTQRGLQDISITRTGRPIIRVQGGRLVYTVSAPPAQLAHSCQVIPRRAYCDCIWRHWLPGPLHCSPTWYALALASSTLYISKAFTRLASRGCTVVVPFREDMAKRHLKVTGDLGRVVFMVGFQSYCPPDGLSNLRRNMTSETQLHSRRVCAIPMLFTISLDGTTRPSLLNPPFPLRALWLTYVRNFSLEDVHIEGAERIAEAVAKYDIDRFVHVSSYNASKDSPSEFFRTKARGEEIVRGIFPETTIVRPAPMFGFEDRLLNKLAGVTNLFTANHLQERFWPVHVSHRYR